MVVIGCHAQRAEIATTSERACGQRGRIHMGSIDQSIRTEPRISLIFFDGGFAVQHADVCMVEYVYVSGERERWFVESMAVISARRARRARRAATYNAP